MSRHDLKMWWTSVSLPAQVNWLQSIFKIYIAFLSEIFFLCCVTTLYQLQQSVMEKIITHRKVASMVEDNLQKQNARLYDHNTKQQCQLQHRSFHLLSYLFPLAWKVIVETKELNDM
jgi:hypothetical protein